jgi:magnesium transporter
LSVALAVICVVLWGNLMGSLLPLFFKSIGVDPAVTSAPFVATLVDVTGIILYFSIASLILFGNLT